MSHVPKRTSRRTVLAGAVTLLAGCGGSGGGNGDDPDGGDDGDSPDQTRTVVEAPSTTVTSFADAEANTFSVTPSDGDPLPAGELSIEVNPVDQTEVRVSWRDRDVSATVALEESLTIHPADGTVTVAGEQVSSNVEAPFTDVTSGTQYLMQVLHFPTNTVLARNYVTA